MDDHTAGGGRADTAPDRALPVPDRLLSVATRLFAERGFERTSVQELVAAAGVTKGAMYHYFASKDDLLYAVYQRVLAMQTERLAGFAAAEGPIGERLHAAAADVVHTTVDNLDDTRIFFRSLHMLPEDKLAAVRKERRAYHERFRGMIEEGQRSGAFRTDVPADIAVTQFFGAVHHLSTWYRPDGELSGAAVGAYFADLFLAGLRPPETAG
ncbi:TetR/AcrR family transcriptional regulator [Streptomonospora nanhaiensis]|uniref:AcrR family transcriptional regulator n=1 Tax=Streptomonospora nanhaiensis TaxID=1323731 RepID=A0A853BPI1_9ACTN|nr:TetR/AcrR family transcriptional regulator [Streptomonospora nanhaiensis]MBV2365940.1 TetR/AcrR family transcriptional regulator [Streptomonospora nanhaiensis]MBX9387750.1 TetR/AcrR family transcriptional regulator [Streptomonospora nanhaiensis]NYI96625.1 AcrR family transcriptional regulator [Streptomonospora nanhaiensis]